MRLRFRSLLEYHREEPLGIAVLFLIYFHQRKLHLFCKQLYQKLFMSFRLPLITQHIFSCLDVCKQTDKKCIRQYTNKLLVHNSHMAWRFAYSLNHLQILFVHCVTYYKYIVRMFMCTSDLMPIRLRNVITRFQLLQIMFFAIA